MQQPSRRGHYVVGAIDTLHVEIGARQLELLFSIAEADNRKLWRDEGCHNMAQWVSGRLGVSCWTAHRWVAASHAIPKLPLVAQALQSGRLSLDKVVELCRFATPATENKLVSWAKRVSVATVRQRADVFNKPALEEVRSAQQSRFVRWWWNEGGTGLGLEGFLPADQGASLVKAITRAAEKVPDEPPAQGVKLSSRDRAEQRYADGLRALASQAIAEDSDADRATVVVHTVLHGLGLSSSEIEGGLGLHHDIARRPTCDARLQYVLTNQEGNALGIGKASRNLPRWLYRQLLYRDHGCTFPGCGTRLFLKAHHIWHWELGGPTDYDNLVLVCMFHHKLLHEGGWNVCLSGEVAQWFKPNGRRYDPGPDPPPGRVQVAA